MPFINSKHRLNPDPNIAGDRCFLHYKWMVEKWKANPRWTTADEIYARVLDLDQPNSDWQRAKELAFMVLWNLYIMPYEIERQKEHGDI